MTRMAKGIRARLVLELLAKGMTGRETRPARHISQRGTGLAGEASERAGVTLGDVAGMPDREACGLLFPAQGEAREAYAGPGWEWVRPEPQRGGVTPGPLWEEHRDGAIRDGLAPEGHDTLRGGHRSYAGARGATNHPGHKPGQVTGVDRDGTPMCEARRRGGRGHQVPPARGDPALLAARLRRGHAGHAAERVARVPRARLGLLRRRGGGDRPRQPRDRRGLPPQGRRGGPRRGPRGSGHPPRDGHHAHGRAQAQAEGRRRGHVRKGRRIHRGEAAQPRLPHARRARRRDARGTRRPRPCPPPGGAREVARRRPGRPGARSWHRCRRCRPGCAGGPADARWLPAPMSRLGATTTPFPTRASARGQISERATPLPRSGLPEGALPPIPGSGRMGGGPAAPVPRTCHRSSRMPSGTTPGCLAGPGRPGRTRTPWHRASSPTRG